MAKGSKGEIKGSFGDKRLMVEAVGSGDKMGEIPANIPLYILTL
jgi:hypothetical protein